MAHAGEIQYAHIEDVYDDELHIEYRGPDGSEHFICDAVTSDCRSFGTTTPDLIPAIGVDRGYSNSADGRYGIVGMPDSGELDTTYTHTLYTFLNDTPTVKAVIPYSQAVTNYAFASGGEHVALFGTDGSVAVFDISGETTRMLTPNQDGLPLRTFSPQGTYLAAYNYTDEAHRVWDTRTGTVRLIPNETPSYFEFSQDERHGAFVDDRDGYQTLYLADLAWGAAGEIGVERVFDENFTVEDYLFYQNDLYVVGNTAEDPYRWVLYRYDVETDEAEIVAENVSYGDYIRGVGDRGLAFLTIDGKNTHVALYHPDTDEVRVIAPVEDSPASGSIERVAGTFDGVPGVLYIPEDPDRNSDLFVWLHGGPRRQTSVGYHSYLSYAVYDELLERIAETGSYVLKVDYAGSYGHGSEHMDALTGNVGRADVSDVYDATREVQDEYDIDDTYLIGNSYGGYLGPKTLVEYPDDFDGAVAINGVFDWFTLLERIPSSPFAQYFANYEVLDEATRKFDLYENASIVNHLEELDREEILLVLGEYDRTVPTWQTREFYETADEEGVNVELLTLPEDHIIRSRESLDELCAFIGDELNINDLDCK